jgi:hypothetical protein
MSCPRCARRESEHLAVHVNAEVLTEKTNIPTVESVRILLCPSSFYDIDDVMKRTKVETIY